MKDLARKNSTGLVPAEKQPAQLELFRLVSDDAFVNAFDFYESIPRYMIARGNAWTVTWNPDGTAAPLKREFTYQGKRYKLTLAPAYIDQPDGGLRAEFPGVKEEILEMVLMKLAIDKGYFTDGWDGRPSSDSFVLFTSIHQIAEELKRRGAKRDKAKSYSYPQIREGLEVLAKTKIHLKSESDDDDLVLSPIADYGHFSEKARREAGSVTDRAAPSSSKAANATIYIRFNALISQAILARSWRQINYERIMDADIYLVRWLTKMLGLRFTYAAPSKSYNIKLSTIIENSGITLYDRMSDNLKVVERALASMTEIVARYTIEKHLAANERTHKGRVLADAMITIWPTQAFAVEQIKTNAHENRLDTAVETSEGRVMAEPRREDFQSYSDYEAAKRARQGGSSVAKG